MKSPKEILERIDLYKGFIKSDKKLAAFFEREQKEFILEELEKEKPDMHAVVKVTEEYTRAIAGAMDDVGKYHEIIDLLEWVLG